MTEQEFNAWVREQMRSAGHWKVDLIHNKRTDLLAYVAEPKDPTRGIYVHLEEGRLTAGRFVDAVPHMGEALYTVKTNIKTEDPFKTAVERLGLGFLLALTHGTSPYRAM